MSEAVEATLSEVVTEILALLRLADAAAGVEEPRGDLADAAEAALGLKGQFQILSKNIRELKFVPPDQLKTLSALGTQFTNTYSGTPDLKRLESIRDCYKALADAYKPAAELSALGIAKQERLDKLAPTGQSGTVQIADATDGESTELERKRLAIAAALAKATSVEALNALETDLAGLAVEREKLDTVVEARQRRRTEIALAKPGLTAPPETPTALDGPLGTLNVALAVSPFSADALSGAEKALTDLTKAHGAAETAVKPLRLQRAAFTKELDALEPRVAALTNGLAQKDKSLTKDIPGAIAACRALLAVTAPASQTAEFPAELTKVHQSISSAVGLVTTDQRNPSAQAVTAFVVEEFRQLRAEVDQLPTPDDTCGGYKKSATAQIKAVQGLISQASGGSVAKARKGVSDLRGTINAWREQAGAAAIVLEQRKAALEQQMAQPDPALADAAFKAALKDIRDPVRKLLARSPTVEADVAAAETEAAAFPALLAKATADAAAEARVRAAQSTLTASLAGVIDGASRPASKVELTKARDAVAKLEALTGMGRDRARTAGALEALVLRMQAVAAEGDFAGTDKAPFTGIDPSVQALAFELCGPTAIGTYDAGAKKALSDALVADGPAIKQVMSEVFGDDPRLFNRVLAECGPAGLSALARAVGGDAGTAARAVLNGLLEKGGLGVDPKILVTLLNDGVSTATDKPAKRTGNAQRIRALADSFPGEDGQKAMGTLMGECGLGAGPDALPSLLLTGCAGDCGKLRGFADGFVGDAPERQKSRADLARTMGDGGMSRHGKVLGPLVRDAGVDGVKALGAAFAAPEDCKNLAGLLDKGGMGGDTSTAARKHEHPDTLAKVFTVGMARADGQGVKGNAERLRRYAGAFSGDDGAALSKKMLDATNEFADDFADSRKPGETIATLLDADHLNGNVEKLRTKFMAGIDTIPDETQRRKATRFAAHMSNEAAQEGWKPTSPEMTGEGIVGVTASVLKRHKPQTFDRKKMKDAVLHSQFPIESDVGALLDEAMGKIGAGRNHSQTVPVGDPPFDVEIGFLNGDTVNHFGPRGDVVAPPPAPPHPKETATFTTDEINAILDAVR
jgi:hypothetical protein